MDENTLKLLRDLATHAREAAGKIHQPRPKNSVTFSLTENHYDKNLRDIEDQLLRVAAAIEKL